MAHKFADNWKVRTLDLAKPPGLVDRGRLDLTKMDEDGHIADGWYYEEPTGVAYQITGEVFDVGDLTFLSLEHIDNLSHYRGVLTKEDGPKMKIVGSRFTRAEEIRKQLLAEQDEEPWIILKP